MNKRDERNYLSIGELISETLKRANTDPLFTAAKQESDLDYELTNPFEESTLLKLCEFDVIGTVEYGGSEGIYGEIMLRGDWLPEEERTSRSRELQVLTYKTLQEDKAAYLAMGRLVTIFCYYANETVRENISRFD